MHEDESGAFCDEDFINLDTDMQLSVNFQMRPTQYLNSVSCSVSLTLAAHLTLKHFSTAEAIRFAGLKTE